MDVISDGEAVKRLAEMARERGTLRIITNECASEACNPSGHDESVFKLTDSRHFVIHDVVRVEGPNSRGQYRAWSAEGDWCQGQPLALLSRLLEASYGTIPQHPLVKRRGFWSRLRGR